MSFEASAESSQTDTVSVHAPTPPSPRSTAIAPAAHTLAILVVLLLNALFSHQRAAPAIVEATPHMMRLLSSIVFEWLLLGAAIGGIYRRREFFRLAMSSRTPGFFVIFARGFGIFLLGMLAILLVGGLISMTPLRGMMNRQAVEALLPHTTAQLAVWFLVSLTAGICEEFLFRGYLLQQFIAWTKRPLLAVLLVSLVFGGLHLYEGLAAVLPIAALGMVYGLFTLYFRGDLRTVIVAHTLQDFLTALFALAVPYMQRHAHQGHALVSTLQANISSLASLFS